MAIDGEISPWATGVLVLAVIATMVYSWTHYGIVPKREHLKDPKGIPYAAFWNFLSSEKWTEEGIRFHLQVIKFCAKAFFGLIALWLFLDLITG